MITYENNLPMGAEYNPFAPWEEKTKEVKVRIAYFTDCVVTFDVAEDAEKEDIEETAKEKFAYDMRKKDYDIEEIEIL